MTLTRQQQKLYDLLSNAPCFVTWQEIAEVMFARSGPNQAKHIQVLLCRLRKKGIRIESGGYGKGYRLAREEK